MAQLRGQVHTDLSPSLCLATHAPVAQQAEAVGLNPIQYGFESHRGHPVMSPDIEIS